MGITTDHAELQRRYQALDRRVGQPGSNVTEKEIQAMVDEIVELSAISYHPDPLCD